MYEQYPQPININVNTGRKMGKLGWGLVGAAVIGAAAFGARSCEGDGTLNHAVTINAVEITEADIKGFAAMGMDYEVSTQTCDGDLYGALNVLGALPSVPNCLLDKPTATLRVQAMTRTITDGSSFVIKYDPNAQKAYVTISDVGPDMPALNLSQAELSIKNGKLGMNSTGAAEDAAENALKLAYAVAGLSSCSAQTTATTERIVKDVIRQTVIRQAGLPGNNWKIANPDKDIVISYEKPKSDPSAPKKVNAQEFLDYVKVQGESAKTTMAADNKITISTGESTQGTPQPVIPIISGDTFAEVVNKITKDDGLKVTDLRTGKTLGLEQLKAGIECRVIGSTADLDKAKAAAQGLLSMVYSSNINVAVRGN